MATERDEEQGRKVGFSSLSSMVSDVEATIAKARTSTESFSSSHADDRTRPEDPAEDQASSHLDDDADTETTEPAAYPAQMCRPLPEPTAGSFGKLLFGGAVIVGLFWVMSELTDHKPQPNPQVRSPSNVSTAPTPARQPSTTPPKSQTRPTEQKPPVGRDHTLTAFQINYCLAERIRIDAAETVISRYSTTDIGRFNAFVNDYNSRCGEFRYRSGALESAKRAIEPYREQIQQEGRSLFSGGSAARGGASSTQTQPPQIRAIPAQAPQTSIGSRFDPDVQEIQRRLTSLGYDAGPADGLIGPRTRNAIRSFQRDMSITEDGAPSSKLLEALRSVSVPGNVRTR